MLCTKELDQISPIKTSNKIEAYTKYRFNTILKDADRLNSKKNKTQRKNSDKLFNLRTMYSLDFHGSDGTEMF